MATVKRIDVTPDSEGRIVLLCGDEVMELFVKARAPTPPPPPPPKGKAKEGGTKIIDIPIDIDRGYAYTIRDGPWDEHVDHIIRSALEEHRNPLTAKVDKVTIKSGVLDVHGANRLAGRLKTRLPGSRLRVDLSSKGPGRRG